MTVRELIEALTEYVTAEPHRADQDVQLTATVAHHAVPDDTWQITRDVVEVRRRGTEIVLVAG